MPEAVRNTAAINLESIVCNGTALLVIIPVQLTISPIVVLLALVGASIVFACCILSLVS
jgi:hypothetical protein